jgi:hypothetical protein
MDRTVTLPADIAAALNRLEAKRIRQEPGYYERLMEQADLARKRAKGE